MNKFRIIFLTAVLLVAGTAGIAVFGDSSQDVSAATSQADYNAITGTWQNPLTSFPSEYELSVDDLYTGTSWDSDRAYIVFNLANSGLVQNCRFHFSGTNGTISADNMVGLTVQFIPNYEYWIVTASADVASVTFHFPVSEAGTPAFAFTMYFVVVGDSPSTSSVKLVAGQAYNYHLASSDDVIAAGVSGALWLGPSETSAGIGISNRSTVPTGTYPVTIAVSSTDPTQAAVQFVLYTVDAKLTLSYTNQKIVQGTAFSASPTVNLSGASYSVTGNPTGITVDKSTGKISGTTSVAAGSYTLKVTATKTGYSGSNNTATATVTVVVDAKLNLTYSPSTAYTFSGKSITLTPSGASGATFSANWNGITGLSISSDGKITGTPSKSGSITITATKTGYTAGTNTSSKTVTVTVDPKLTLSYDKTRFDIISGSSITATATSNITGVTYSANWNGITGLTIDASTGKITGSPSKAGTVTITVTKSGYNGATASQTATQTITLTTQATLNASVSGTLYLVTGKIIPFNAGETVTLSWSGPTGATVTWSLVNANNTGVTVSADGTIGGTAGAVTSSATVTVKCTSVLNGVTQTKNVTITVVIKPVLEITSDPAKDATIS